MGKYYKQHEVEQLTGLKKEQIDALINAGAFPRPVRIGLRFAGWRKSVIDRMMRGVR